MIRIPGIGVTRKWDTTPLKVDIISFKKPKINPSQQIIQGFGEDMFTIKLHYGGNFSETDVGIRYVGGSFDYFDLCEADTMSLLELISMLKECGEIVEDRDVLSDCNSYCDASNMDSIDDEVCNHKNLRDKKKKEKAKGKGKKKAKNRVNIYEQSAEKEIVPEKDKLEDNKSYSEDEEGNVSDASTNYASSDEERMACNLTNEEKVIFPVFNPITDMKDP
ncbi:hypothetical protein AgCh_029177 [Apium graveolens]